MVTGASSGIGRLTARRLAERDVSVVLAARSEQDLVEAAQECQRYGARTLVVPTDVGDEQSVEALADKALERFERIDAWVNNAGVIAYGGFEDMPSDVYEQVIRTNLFGQIYGARAALRAFRRTGTGVVVNISSVWGRITSPYVGAYVVSKHGVRAFSESLREGLNTQEGSDDIHVCTVLPESIDTPIFRHAANYVGRPVKPVPPVDDPERVARMIVSCIERPRLEVTVGSAGHGVEWAARMLPDGIYNRIVPWLFDHTVFEGGSVETTTGNVLAPEPELNQVDGGWRDPPEVSLRRRAFAAALAMVPIAVTGFIMRRAMDH